MKKELLYPALLSGKSKSHVLAYVALMTAFAVVANSLEFKFLDNQFSLTVFVALTVGIVIGPLFGFVSCFLADVIGFLVNPGGIYMPWVGISTATFALLSGLIMHGVPKGKYFKLVFICIVSFAVCTVAINSTGFYFYNRAMGFSTAVLDYVASKFGGEVSFWAYIVYRLIFKGQIWNSVFNYALFLIVYPLLEKIKPLGLKKR